MILRSLEFSGIGPFKDQYAIDFDALSADGLFLFDGPTGSGKSTLIDAITFALFGSVAGKNSSNERIRSTHADPKVESWVDLVFTVSSGTYRVRRSPSWRRLKKSAQKRLENAAKQIGSDHAASVEVANQDVDFTQVNETAKFWQINPAGAAAKDWSNGTPIATQVRDVRPAVESVIGLSKDQFLQTVILPQGQFAQFLQLKSSERQPILKAIFRTHKYSDFTANLQQRAKISLQKIDDCKREYLHTIQTWRENQGIPTEMNTQIELLINDLYDAPTIPAPEIDQDLLEVIATANAALEKQAKNSQTLAGEAQKAEDHCRAQLFSEQQLISLINERIELETKLAELKTRQPEYEQNVQAVVLSQKAQLPYSRLTDYFQGSNKLAQIHQDEAKIWDEYEQISINSATNLSSPAVTEVNLFFTQLENLNHDELIPIHEIQVIQDTAARVNLNLEETAQQLGKKIAKFEALNELETEVATVTTQIAELETEQCKYAKSRAEVEAALKDLPKKLTAAKQLADEAAKLSSTIAELELKLTQKIKTKAAIDETTALESQLVTAKKAAATAAKQLEKAKKNYQNILHNWQNSFAAQLAKELKAGAACPVCGATTHPQPATANDPVNEAQVTAAQAEIDIAQAEFNERNHTLTTISAQLTVLRKETGEINSAKLASEITALEDELTTAHQAETQNSILQQNVADLVQQEQELNQKNAELRANISALEAERKLSEAQLAEKTAKLKVARGKDESIKITLKKLNQQHKSLTALIKAHRTTANTLEAFADTVQLATHAISESPFKQAQEVIQAYLTESETESLSVKVRGYEEQLQTTQARLSDEKISATKGSEKPDLANREAELNTLTEKRKMLANQAATANQFALDAKRLQRQIKNAAEIWHQTIETSKSVVRLADLANAQVPQHNRIPLDMWVLLRRFETVVARANIHLGEISGGRYELMRSEESGRIKKTGLGLSMIDRDGSPLGDVIRPTTSLSGGETFYTSLALALALAEVVQEETGGVRIETLIIDEGFGTLSDGIRDLVMQTLRSLQRNGRKIGIVSHVPDLKQLVANRIAITQQATGESTLKVIC